MLLLDRVVAATDRSVTCEVALTKDFVFLENGVADVLVCVELVAQTVGAYVGLQQREKGEPPQTGFLVGCRNAVFSSDCLSEGEQLIVQAEHVWGDGAFGKFAGQVERGGVVIASMDVSVVRPDRVGTGLGVGE